MTLNKSLNFPGSAVAMATMSQWTEDTGPVEDSWGCPITPSLSSSHPNVSSSGLANNPAQLSLQHLQNIQALPTGPKGLRQPLPGPWCLF